MRAADVIPLPAVLLRRLDGAGIDSGALLREAGLPPALLTSTRAQVDTAGFFRLWAALDRLNGDPALGLRLASEVAADQLDVASIAAMHAPTFGESLAKLARYKRLVCPEDVQITRQDGELAVGFRWLLCAAAPPPRLIDACFAAVLLLARNGTGLPLSPLRVEFMRAEQHRRVFESHFGCRVHFGAALDRIVFDDQCWRLPLRTSNPDLLAMLLPGLEAAIEQRVDIPFVDQVRTAIRSRMQGQRPLAGAVARALALSPRSLQRRLAEHGTSYQRLLDQVRQQTARELLATTALASGEIAFLLGFEELNSFDRAFSAWEGTTPLRWRQGVQPPAQAPQRQ
jgi:AraC-like DNA-binding protein